MAKKLRRGRKKKVTPAPAPAEEAATPETPNTVFNKLLNGSHLDGPFQGDNSKLKTYANRKRKRSVSVENEDKILEFEDCKNRDYIIQWLNDNRNVFDRLTQTQTQTCRHNFQEEENLAGLLDMPSVSQANDLVIEKSQKLATNHKENHNNINRHYSLRSAGLPRTKSLEIHVEKNLKRGRVKRHSLAADTPTIENYEIEDNSPQVVIGDESQALLGLMEDDYLSLIEKELDRTDVNGWDRLKTINKVISGTKKEPKKLNVTIKSPGDGDKKTQKSGPDLGLYKLNIFEEYMAKNMDWIQDMSLNHDPGEPDELEGPHKVRTRLEPVRSQEKSVLDQTIESANNFIHKLDLIKADSTKLALIKPFYLKIQAFFAGETQEKAVGTEVRATRMFGTQTEVVEAKTTGIQTEVLCLKHVECQTESVSEEASKTGIAVPARCELNNSLDDLDFDTEDIMKGQNSISIKSKIPVIENSRYNVGNEAAPPFLSKTAKPLIINEEIEPPVTPDGAKPPVSSLPEKGLDLSVFSSDKNSSLGVKIEDIINDLSAAKSGQSVLIISQPCFGTLPMKRGMKRPLPSSEEIDADSRPCDKFLHQDLSVAFDSEDLGIEENRDLRSSTSTKSPEAPSVEEPPTSKRSKTQEIRDECDLLILKATDALNKIVKPANNFVILPSIKSTKQSKGSSEGFDHHSLFLDENNLNQLEAEAEKSFIALEKKTAERKPSMDWFNVSSPKKIRRSLFKGNRSQDPTQNRDEIEKKHSESLFSSDIINLITPNKNHVVGGNKINILANVILQNTVDDNKRDNDKKKCNDLDLEDVDLQNSQNSDSTLSDIDVVESTPQKKFPSFSEQRNQLFDITLPPPLEFQDQTKLKQDSQGKDQVENYHPSAKPDSSFKLLSRRPLSTLNENKPVHSTPHSTHADSEKIISLSPISHDSNKVLGPLDIAQKSYFSPLSTTPRINKSKTSSTILINSNTKKSQLTPNNASGKQQSILNYLSQSSQNSVCDSISTPTSTPPIKPCIACTRLTKEQIIAISSLTNRKLATYSSSFSSKVTHLIVATNEKFCIKDHTIKFVLAVASGIWIVSFDWIQECLRQNRIVSEEPYEVLDVSGIDGPRLSRLNHIKKPLLKGYKIHVAGPFPSTSQKDVESVVKLMGGKIATKVEDFLDDNSSIRVIITEAIATGDFDLYELWLDTFRVITVDIEWLSRSVGQYKLLSLRPFALCSDTTLNELNYPPELLEDVPFSFLQNTNPLPTANQH